MGYQMESPDDARRQIDEEILQQEKSIIALKSKRNTLAPIAKLPPELLTSIFVICAQGPCDVYFRSTDWIKLTHVSHHWRTVALNSPNLWVHLVFHSIRWCEEMLRRTKMAPLFINVWESGSSIRTRSRPEAVLLALKCIHRAKELTINLPMSTVKQIFAETPTSAPILEKLSLHNMEITPDFLSEDSSSLRRLELKCCNAKWNARFLSGLTHMKIHNITKVTRPTTAQLLDILEKMPHLQVLDLADCLPLNGLSVLDHTVNLSHLKALELIGTISECENLLKHVSFPASTEISFQCSSGTGSEVNDIDFSSILSIFSRRCTSGSITTHRQLVGATFTLGSQAIKFSGYETTLPVNHFRKFSDSNVKPAIHLTFSWFGSMRLGPDVCQQVMLDLCRALPLSGIKAARIAAGCDFNTSVWGMTLGHITSLTDLSVVLSADTLLSSLVLRRPDASECSNSSQLNFPSLRNLSLDGVDFDEYRDKSKAKWENFLDVMMERCEHDAEIRTITLTNCYHLLPEDVDRLREIVVDVDWDGTIFQDEDEDEDYSEDDDYPYGMYDSDDGMYYDTDHSYLGDEFYDGF